MTTNINHKGVELQVQYEYWENAEVNQIEAIYYDNINVLEIYDQNYLLDEINELINLNK